MGTARASPAPLRALGPPPFPARPCSPRGAGRPAHGQASGGRPQGSRRSCLQPEEEPAICLLLTRSTIFNILNLTYFCISN